MTYEILTVAQRCNIVWKCQGFNGSPTGIKCTVNTHRAQSVLTKIYGFHLSHSMPRQTVFPNPRAAQQGWWGWGKEDVSLLKERRMGITLRLCWIWILAICFVDAYAWAHIVTDFLSFLKSRFILVRTTGEPRFKRQLKTTHTKYLIYFWNFLLGCIWPWGAWKQTGFASFKFQLSIIGL